MQDNIIIANNIALSRNINNYPFPHKLSQTESQNISQKINNISVIVKTYENKTMNYINKIANKISERDDMVALFALTNNDKLNLLFACSKNLEQLDMNNLLKDSIKLVDGKGGGSKVLAQGGGKNNGNLDSLFDYMKMKLKSN